MENENIVAHDAFFLLDDKTVFKAWIPEAEERRIRHEGLEACASLDIVESDGGNQVPKSVKSGEVQIVDIFVEMAKPLALDTPFFLN